MGCYLFPAVSHRRTHCRIRFLPAFRAAFRPVPRAAFRPVILGVERIAIARAASLPDFRAASLVDYSLIAPSACRLFRLHTVRAAFSERPSRRSRDVVTVRQPIAHARVYRLRSPHRSTQPYRLTPSMPPLSLEMAAARPSRRMAPRWAGRENQICPIGEDRHGSRWRPPDMPDAVPYARSRRSSGQRIPDTDIEAREAGGMRYACRDLYRLRYRALRHIAFAAENPFPCDFDPFVAGRIICSGWVWPSRAYWNHGRGIAHGGSARLS